MIAVSTFAKKKALAHYWRENKFRTGVMNSLCGDTMERKDALTEDLGGRRVCKNCERIARRNMK
jgi:hypothetical protein